MDQETKSVGAFEVCILGGGALSVAVWAGAQLAAFLGGGDFLDLSLGDALGALVQLPSHAREPQLAWPEEVRSGLPGTILYWLATALVVAAVAAVALVVIRSAGGGREALDRRSRLGVPATGRIARPSDLRPLVVRRPAPGRVVLGLCVIHI